MCETLWMSEDPFVHFMKAMCLYFCLYNLMAQTYSHSKWSQLWAQWKFDPSSGLSTWSLNLRVMWILCVCPVMDQGTVQGVTLSLTQCLLGDSNTSWPSFAVSNNSECTEVNSKKCNTAIGCYHYCWGSGGSTPVWNRLMLNNYKSILH